MEAVVLVGGQGTRLRPLTESTPKPMLPVAGVPFVAHQLARLREAGVTHVVLATSYRAEIFTAHFGDGSAYGLRLTYVHEDEPLGTGGGIRNAANVLEWSSDDSVIVLNGDNLSGHDLGAQLTMHRATGAVATLHLVRVADARAYGCVPTDADSRVTAFLEKMPEPVTDQINAGCYVLARSVLEAIPAGRVVSVERETFPALLASAAVVMGYVDSAYWIDVGTPADYIRAGSDVVTGVVRSPAYEGPIGPAYVMAGAIVDPSAVVCGGSTIGPGARVGRHAVVDGSVVMADAVIGEGAVVRRSAIGVGAVIADGDHVEDAVAV